MGVSAVPVKGRAVRWFAMAAIGFIVLALPLVLGDQITEIANQAVAAAKHQPMLVALLIILALAFDVFLPVPNGITNTLAGRFSASPADWRLSGPD